MKKRVMGVFKTEELAVLAIKRLETDGYTNNEISVIAKKRDKLERIEEVTDIHIEHEHSSGAVSGAVAGGVIGGIGALLVEIGVFAIPGVGPLLAAGPIALTIAGIAAGGAIGGVSGALMDYGFTETEAREYSTYLDQGNILVLVDVRSDVDLVYRNFSKNESLINYEYLKGVTR